MGNVDSVKSLATPNFLDTHKGGPKWFEEGSGGTTPVAYGGKTREILL